jgi:hypothetical protein
MDALAAAVPAIVLIVVMFAAVFELLFQRQRGGSDSGRRSRPAAADYADGGAMGEIRTADESVVRETRPVDQGAIRLAAILGALSTAALLGLVSVATGLGVAGWIAGLATGSAATALIVTARMRSDQPGILPADWITLTRAVLCAGVAGLVAASFDRPVSITALVTLSAVAL